MKKIITILFLSLTLFSNAQNKNAKAEIEVDGVCNSCKVRIEKNAIGVKGVKFGQLMVLMKLFLQMKIMKKFLIVVNIEMKML